MWTEKREGEWPKRGRKRRDTIFQPGLSQWRREREEKREEGRGDGLIFHIPLAEIPDPQSRIRH